MCSGIRSENVLERPPVWALAGKSNYPSSGCGLETTDHEVMHVMTQQSHPKQEQSNCNKHTCTECTVTTCFIDGIFMQCTVTACFIDGIFNVQSSHVSLMGYSMYSHHMFH